MTKDEALKMAIEAMYSAYSSHGKILTSNPAQDAWVYHGCDAKLFKALQACKEALDTEQVREDDAQPSVAELNDEYLRDTHVEGLSQPAQEPVAWKVAHMDGSAPPPYIVNHEPFYKNDSRTKVTPLYTHPAPLWVGLSEYDILSIDGLDCVDENYLINFARAIEQALKEKNT